MEHERDDEAALGQKDDQDQKEEKHDEGGDTDSIKTYVKNIIAFHADDDDDDKRSPHATSSPKGNITIMLHIIQSYSCTILYYIMLPSMKYKLFYLWKLQSFANDYCNPNQVKMSKQTNGFN